MNAHLSTTQILELALKMDALKFEKTKIIQGLQHI